MDKQTYFWTLITITMAVFLIGVYRNLVSKIAYILWVNRIREGEDADPVAGRKQPLPGLKTIMNEAILQKRIQERSGFLWARHLLIFTGFMLIFVFDVFLTLVEKYVPIEYFHTGAGRGFLKFALEASGAVLLVGLTLGIVHRLIYAQRERTLIDLKLLVLLWFVVVTGYLTEAFRFIVEPSDPFIAASFIAGPLAEGLKAFAWPWEQLASWMWIVHATITLAFFACIPFTRFVHVFASPLGRSTTLREAFVKHKRQQITEGLL